MTDILLATFNSGEMLSAQLDSILAQTDGDWRLLARDAGSTDGTPAVLARYAARDHRIKVLDGGPASACESFAALLAASTAQYVMFCDHDDVWLPEKVANSVAALKALEAGGAADVPALVFTDAKVVRSDLSPLAKSFFRRTALDPSRVAPNELAFQNVAPGCTMAFNAALRRKAAPIPHEAVMHDHWMMLVATVFGEIRCLREPTLLYRQHAGNALGSPKVGAGYFARLAMRGPSALRARVRARARQAAAFAARYGDAAPECLRAAGRMADLGFFARRAAMLRHGLFMGGFMRTLGMFIVA